MEINGTLVLSAVTAASLMGGLVLNWRAGKRASRTEQAALYFDLSERWSVVLSLLYQIRLTPPPTVEELRRTHPDVRTFLMTENWRELYRPICNFFENVGLIVHNRNLDIETVRVLITVNEEDYVALSPILEYLRRHYRNDIYVFWDYLISASRSADALSPKWRKPFVPPSGES